jgi:hypothetical protein
MAAIAVQIAEEVHMMLAHVPMRVPSVEDAAPAC